MPAFVTSTRPGILAKTTTLTADIRLPTASVISNL